MTSRKSLDALILTNTFPPGLDGIGDYSFNLYSLLKSEGKKVGVITKRSDKHEAPEVCQTDIFAISPNWGFRGCLSIWRIVKLQQTKTLLVQYEPYSFSKTGIPIVFILFIGFCRCKGINVHANFHEIAIRFIDQNIYGKLRSILQRSAAYLLCIFSHSLQTSNIYYSRLLLPFKSLVVPIPSNFEQLCLDVRPSIAKLPDVIVIVVNANRCNDFVFEVIYSLSQLKEKEIKIIIVGRADEQELFWIQDRIEKFSMSSLFDICVNCTPEVYVGVLHNATFFLQFEAVTSNKHGGVSSKSGTTALAMQLGIPIIATYGDMTDINLFKDRNNVFLLPFSNSYYVANKILELANDKGKLMDISREAKRYYWKYFCWENTIKAYLKFCV